MKRSIELRIKIKSLAEEAKIIRHEERKLDGMERYSLQQHRKTIVRDAARRTISAYLHILGRDITEYLPKSEWHKSLDKEAINKMVMKYGDTEAKYRPIGEKADTTVSKTVAVSA